MTTKEYRNFSTVSPQRLRTTSCSTNGWKGQAETKQIRRYRMAVVAAFVAGIVLGSGLLVFILAIPSDTPLFTFGINFYPLQFIEQNSRMICVLLTSLMIAFCIIAMMNTSEMVSRIRGREM